MQLGVTDTSCWKTGQQLRLSRWKQHAHVPGLARLLLHLWSSNLAIVVTSTSSEKHQDSKLALAFQVSEANALHGLTVRSLDTTWLMASTLAWMDLNLDDERVAAYEPDLAQRGVVTPAVQPHQQLLGQVSECCCSSTADLAEQYRQAAASLSTPLGSCAMLADQPGCCEAAQSLGMQCALVGKHDKTPGKYSDLPTLPYHCPVN